LTSVVAEDREVAADRTRPTEATRARRMLLCVAVAVAAATGGTSQADDGAYVTESFGVASGHGGLAGLIGNPLHLRLGIGMRIGHVAIEPWFLSDLQTDRTGAFRGIAGGQPAAGSADLEAMGLDAKYIISLDRRLEVFGRAGPLVAEANGALTGYRGRGFGVAAGAQLTGKVRALGFLWSPLFFVRRGPMVTGALFLDAGYDFYFLRAHGAALDARVGHVSVGFAIGSAF
jgi:hypothetical protein